MNLYGMESMEALLWVDQKLLYVEANWRTMTPAELGTAQGQLRKINEWAVDQIGEDRDQVGFAGHPYYAYVERVHNLLQAMAAPTAPG